MAWVKLVHLAAVILWFGSAAADIVLEFTLKGEKERRAQLALIRLHSRIDQAMESPAIILTILTGIVLIMFGGRWEPLVAAKILCGMIAAGANLYCVKVVMDREAWAVSAPPDVDLLQSPEGRSLGLRIFATGSGIPFAAAALIIASVYL